VNNKIKIGFFRGLNFSSPVGASDWRIMLYINKDIFDSYVFGRRETNLNLKYSGTQIIAPKVRLIPLITSLVLSSYYVFIAWQKKLDLVICNPGIFLAGFFFFFLLPDTRVIFDIRTIPAEASSPLEKVHNWFLKLAFKLKFYDAVTVITKSMLRDLDELYHFSEHVPTSVWESGYDDKIFQPQKTKKEFEAFQTVKGKFKIMFHGKFSPTRGLDNMVRALSLLKESGNEDIALILIGQGAAESELRNLSKTLGVSAQVVILPPMLQEQLPDYLAYADLGIDLLPDHKWWRSQSPLKLYEFLGMGIPVLATNIACHQNISNAVILIPDNHPETIAYSIEKLVEGNNFRNLSQIALEDAKDHTWKSRAKILEDFIRTEVLVPQGK
jgi:glycosyltransferase involved in cell wall biosynthesis